MKKVYLTVLFLSLLLLLCACRVRTTLIEPEITAPVTPVKSSAAVSPEPEQLPEEQPPQQEQLPEEQPPEPEQLPEEQPPEPENPQDEAVNPDAPSQQDETSERREFSPDADGELTPDAETPLYAPADEGTAAPAPTAGDGEPVNVEAEHAEQTATETVPSDEAEQLGVDESGETAESVQTYYLTLLADRVGDLFECKRLYVYWETDEDHRTVHKSSLEHQLILGAGAYDVSAKLLEENLTVDDGWVSRKNPDVVVKVVDGGALDIGAAQALCEELSARSDWAGITAIRERRVLVLSHRLLDTQAGQTAAMVYLAKLMYPTQMEDVDADEALRALTEEGSGSAYSGAYSYAM